MTYTWKNSLRTESPFKGCFKSSISAAQIESHFKFFGIEDIEAKRREVADLRDRGYHVRWSPSDSDAAELKQRDKMSQMNVMERVYYNRVIKPRLEKRRSALVATATENGGAIPNTNYEYIVPDFNNVPSSNDVAEF